MDTITEFFHSEVVRRLSLGARTAFLVTAAAVITVLRVVGGDTVDHTAAPSVTMAAAPAHHGPVRDCPVIDC